MTFTFFCPLWWCQTRPTPPHLTSAMAENILAAACESETRNAAKRMRLDIYQAHVSACVRWSLDLESDWVHSRKCWLVFRLLSEISVSFFSLLHPFGPYRMSQLQQTSLTPEIRLLWLTQASHWPPRPTPRTNSIPTVDLITVSVDTGPLAIASKTMAHHKPMVGWMQKFNIIVYLINFHLFIFILKTSINKLIFN